MIKEKTKTWHQQRYQTKELQNSTSQVKQWKNCKNCQNQLFWDLWKLSKDYSSTGRVDSRKMSESWQELWACGVFFPPVPTLTPQPTISVRGSRKERFHKETSLLFFDPSGGSLEDQIERFIFISSDWELAHARATTQGCLSHHCQVNALFSPAWGDTEPFGQTIH